MGVPLQAGTGGRELPVVISELLPLPLVPKGRQLRAIGLTWRRTPVVRPELALGGGVGV